jgi:hypothetical protein
MIKRRLFPFIVLFLLISVSINSYADKRVAFIIGNSEYMGGGYNTLTQPVNDADAMDEALKSFGFTTILLKNGNLEQMIDSLATFCSILEGADAAVFYYSGHGNTIAYEEYIIPAKTQIRNVALESQFLRLNSIQAEMKKRSKLSFIFFDACRNEPKAEIPVIAGTKGSFVELYGGNKNNVMICYATKSGQPASPGSGTISPFTEVLLENIYKQEDFSWLWRNKIKPDSRFLEQEPQNTGGYDGIFYFNKPPTSHIEKNDLLSNKLNVKDKSDSITVDYLISQLDFRGAINLLNNIPYSSQSSNVKEKVSKYSFYLKEQEAGRIVSPKLANAISPYITIEPFHNGYSRLTYTVNNKINNGFVSTKGDIVYPSDYLPLQWSQFSDSMSYSSNGRDYLNYLLDSNLNTIGLGYKLGSNGSTIKSWSYCSDKKFSEGLLAVKNIESGKWGYINKRGDIVIKCKYDVASDFSQGLAFVRKGDNCYYIDNQGKIIIKNFHKSVYNMFTDNWMWINYKSRESEYVLTSRWGDKDNCFPKSFSKNGINVTIDYINPGRYDISCVKAHYSDGENRSKDFSFFIDGSGDILYDFEKFDKPTYFCEERAIVYKNGLCGVINLRGDVSIPYGKFDNIGDFYNGLAVASKKGKYGFIDKDGNIVIDFIYDWAKPFTDVFALVVLNGRYGFVDKYGFSTLTVDIGN